MKVKLSDELHDELKLGFSLVREAGEAGRVEPGAVIWRRNGDRVVVALRAVVKPGTADDGSSFAAGLSLVCARLQAETVFAAFAACRGPAWGRPARDGKGDIVVSLYRCLADKGAWLRVMRNEPGLPDDGDGDPYVGASALPDVAAAMFGSAGVAAASSGVRRVLLLCLEGWPRSGVVLTEDKELVFDNPFMKGQPDEQRDDLLRTLIG